MQLVRLPNQFLAVGLRKIGSQNQRVPRSKNAKSTSFDLCVATCYHCGRHISLLGVYRNIPPCTESKHQVSEWHGSYITLWRSQISHFFLPLRQSTGTKDISQQNRGEIASGIQNKTKKRNKIILLFQKLYLILLKISDRQTKSICGFLLAFLRKHRTLGGTEIENCCFLVSKLTQFVEVWGLAAVVIGGYQTCSWMTQKTDCLYSLASQIAC